MAAEPGSAGPRRAARGPSDLPRGSGRLQACPHVRAASLRPRRIKLMARVGEEFPLACPTCGGDIRLIGSLPSSRSRGRSERFSHTSASRSNLRPSLPPVARRSTGASSCRSTTIAKRFRCRPSSCPRSTSTASDRCQTPGHDRAPRPPDSERLCAQARKTPLQRGKAGGQGNAWCGPGDRSTRLTSRSSARKCFSKCHWPGYPLSATGTAARRPTDRP